MTVIAIGAAKGSPGVTTTVLALAACWPAHREPMIVEADPSGGDVVARLAQLSSDGGGLGDRPSTVQLAAASRSGVSARLVLEHLQRLPGPGEVRALVAPPGPFAAATAIDALVSGGLSRSLAALDSMDTMIDVGRIDPTSPTIPLVRGADRVILVARPTLESVVHTRELVGSLRIIGCRVSLVVIGDRPYVPIDAADAIDADGLLAALPDDPVGVQALAGNARSLKILARTRLVHAATATAELLAATPSPPADSLAAAAPVARLAAEVVT